MSIPAVERVASSTNVSQLTLQARANPKLQEVVVMNVEMQEILETEGKVLKRSLPGNIEISSSRKSIRSLGLEVEGIKDSLLINKNIIMPDNKTQEWHKRTSSAESPAEVNHSRKLSRTASVKSLDSPMLNANLASFRASHIE